MYSLSMFYGQNGQVLVSTDLEAVGRMLFKVLSRVVFFFLIIKRNIKFERKICCDIFCCIFQVRRFKLNSAGYGKDTLPMWVPVYQEVFMKYGYK